MVNKLKECILKKKPEHKVKYFRSIFIDISSEFCDFYREIFESNQLKSACDKANITIPQPKDFPEYDYTKEYMKNVDNDIEY